MLKAFVDNTSCILSTESNNLSDDCNVRVGSVVVDEMR